ncbi:unnamed protein product [Ambrosiozyma monospora]|uniref:Unnamed protein product n=1 Tax=Ambrosiozyma monospora TaxID=43982 RepID=A0ACB5TE90_AMBMO|nr:unnamed protein product [Ambrosiozyma monospora]
MRLDLKPRKLSFSKKPIQVRPTPTTSRIANIVKNNPPQQIKKLTYDLDFVKLRTAFRGIKDIQDDPMDFSHEYDNIITAPRISKSLLAMRKQQKELGLKVPREPEQRPQRASTISLDFLKKREEKEKEKPKKQGTSSQLMKEIRSQTSYHPKSLTNESQGQAEPEFETEKTPLTNATTSTSANPQSSQAQSQAEAHANSGAQAYYYHHHPYEAKPRYPYMGRGGVIERIITTSSLYSSTPMPDDNEIQQQQQQELGQEEEQLQPEEQDRLQKMEQQLKLQLQPRTKWGKKNARILYNSHNQIPHSVTPSFDVIDRSRTSNVTFPAKCTQETLIDDIMKCKKAGDLMMRSNSNPSARSTNSPNSTAGGIFPRKNCKQPGSRSDSNGSTHSLNHEAYKKLNQISPANERHGSFGSMSSGELGTRGSASTKKTSASSSSSDFSKTAGFYGITTIDTDTAVKDSVAPIIESVEGADSIPKKINTYENCQW